MSFKEIVAICIALVVIAMLILVCITIVTGEDPGDKFFASKFANSKVGKAILKALLKFIKKN